MEYKGLVLDKFQEDSIKAIDNNHSVVVSAPTGSGKTLIADYIINKYLKKGIKVIYTAPIKALSNQKYKEFTDDYGKKNVGLLTGDISINPHAPILIMTTEVYRNMAISDDETVNEVSYVIFDEVHYINDIERGYVWEESIIFSKSHVRFLCLSATIPNALEFASWIKSIKKHEVEVVKHEERPVPLHKHFYDIELGITSLEKIKNVQDIPQYVYRYGRRRRVKVKSPNHIELIKEIKDKLPCFFFHFSRKGCQDSAKELMKAKIFKLNPEVTAYVRKKLDKVSDDVKNLKSTKLLRETLSYGIGFHHAGLIPIMKALVEELFGLGMIKVLYTTETFAVGINMPAKTVCFKALRKFDGINFRFLNSKEYFQMAGRAGRRGIDKEGFAYAMIDRRDFNYYRMKKITRADLDPIKSQFKLSVNTVLNLLKQHTPEEIEKILKMSFYTYQAGSKGKIKSSFEKIKRKLIRLGYVKDEILTEKGEFSSKIYADEILFGEIFATDFYEDLNEYQILMLVASLVYEDRKKTEFFKTFPSGEILKLKKMLFNNSFLAKEKRFKVIDALTSMIHPCYHGKTIFDIMDNVNYLEGDLIRFFRQMLDRLSQIFKATEDVKLKKMIRNCENLVLSSLVDIDAI